MPDRRTHRGSHPEDARLFASECQWRLVRAADDLFWLLSRGYAPDSSLKLVGDRYELLARQRVAVARCTCGDNEANRRKQHELGIESLNQQALALDGYNILTTIEAALAGGVILCARDGAYRDMASMHGSYRKVAETLPALELIAAELEYLKISQCVWYLDRPVSNSGRLKMVIENLAKYKGLSWRVELVANPDAILIETAEIVASADSAILNECERWFNLARAIVDRHVPQAWIIDLSGS